MDIKIPKTKNEAFAQLDAILSEEEKRDLVKRCSRWDRYLGMTAAMTQVPVPTARQRRGRECEL